jgi:hypothetical protein
MLPQDPNKRKEFFNFINRAVALKEGEDRIKEQVKEDLAILKEEVEELFGKEFVSEFTSKVKIKHQLAKESKKANKVLEDIAELEILEQNHTADVLKEALGKDVHFNG